MRPNCNQKEQPYFSMKHMMEELPQVVIKVRSHDIDHMMSHDVMSAGD